MQKDDDNDGEQDNNTDKGQGNAHVDTSGATIMAPIKNCNFTFLSKKFDRATILQTFVSLSPSLRPSGSLSICFRRALGK